MAESVWQDAEKACQLRSQLIEILNGDPAASPTRRRAQTWCSLFVAPCTPEGTPPVSTRLRPCWSAFLSILRDVILLLETCRSMKFWSSRTVFPEPVRPLPPSLPYDLIRTVNRPQNGWQGRSSPFGIITRQTPCHYPSINENRNRVMHSFGRRLPVY
jgi:hypothetical protein